MKTIRLLSAAASLFIVSSSAAAQPAVAEKLDKYITPFATAGHFSGVVLVAQGGKTVYEKAFGFANAEHRVPNRTDTRIGVASITKPMTAVIARRLIDEGKLSMDDPVSKFLPGFPNGRKITVGMLYRHRSGIPHRVMPPEMETVPYTSVEMLERIKLAKLEFEPDSARLYSSAGYTVLARVLEIASGKSYAALLEQYVFKPAGMTSSVEFDSRALVERRAADYLLDENGVFNAPAKDYSFLVGAGSVLSTARDIHAFGMGVVTGTFGDSVRAGYLRDKVWWANGSTNGHRAEVRVNGEHNYSYAVLSNLNSGANDVVLQGINDIMAGQPIGPPVVPKPVFTSRPVTVLAQYLGVYEREGGSRFDVMLNGESLFAGDVKLMPTSPDCFFEYKYYGDVCFVRDPAQKIVHITWASPGVTSTWVKK